MKYSKNYCEEKEISTSELNEAQRTLYYIAENMKMDKSISEEGYKHFQMAIKALEQEPCEDAISRQAAIDAIKKIHPVDTEYDCTLYDKIDVMYVLKDLPSIQPKRKTGHCKDCKWWKDSDGIYRRGVEAESKCPINRKEVLEGTGYCFMFELQESEDESKSIK